LAAQGVLTMFGVLALAVFFLSCYVAMILYLA